MYLAPGVLLAIGAPRWPKPSKSKSVPCHRKFVSTQEAKKMYGNNRSRGGKQAWKTRKEKARKIEELKSLTKKKYSKLTFEASQQRQESVSMHRILGESMKCYQKQIGKENKVKAYVENAGEFEYQLLLENKKRCRIMMLDRRLAKRKEGKAVVIQNMFRCIVARKVYRGLLAAKAAAKIVEEASTSVEDVVMGPPPRRITVADTFIFPSVLEKKRKELEVVDGVGEPMKKKAKMDGVVDDFGNGNDDEEDEASVEAMTSDIYHRFKEALSHPSVEEKDRKKVFQDIVGYAAVRLFPNV